MDKLKKYLLATGCLVTLVGAFTLFSPVVQQGQAVPPTRDVNVVNPPESPVPVVVQNGNTDGATRELVEFVELTVGFTTIDLATPSQGQRLVITDVTVTAFTGLANMQILRTGEIVSTINLPVGIYQQSYTSGIEFTEGETLSINNTNPSANTNWELRGFLETLPPS